QALNAFMALTEVLGQFSNVPDDGPHQGERLVRLGRREQLLTVHRLLVSHANISHRSHEHAYFLAAAAAGFSGAGGSGGLVHTGSVTSLEPATAVGFSVSRPQATSRGSRA